MENFEIYAIIVARNEYLTVQEHYFRNCHEICIIVAVTEYLVF